LGFNWHFALNRLGMPSVRFVYFRGF